MKILGDIGTDNCLILRDPDQKDVDHSDKDKKMYVIEEKEGDPVISLTSNEDSYHISKDLEKERKDNQKSILTICTNDGYQINLKIGPPHAEIKRSSHLKNHNYFMIMIKFIFVFKQIISKQV